MKKNFIQPNPAWIDAEKFQLWTEGGAVLFAREDKRRGCFWVLVDFDATLQLQRWFSFGENSCEVSVDVDARGGLRGTIAQQALLAVIQ